VRSIFPTVRHNDLRVILLDNPFDDFMEKGKDTMFRDIHGLDNNPRFDFRLRYIIVFKDGV
jgi:hypothetical protein